MTDQDHAKIVREARATQADREAAAQRMDKRYGAGHWLAQEFRDGKQDGSDLLAAFARHRLAAEAAAFERAAGVPLQISGLIGASTGSSIDSALCQASEAIRKLAGEKHD